MACCLLPCTSLHPIADQIGPAVSTTDGRFLVHKLVKWSIVALGTINSAFLPQHAQAIKKLVEQSDLLLGAASFFPYSGYFMTEKPVATRLIEADGIVYAIRQEADKAVVAETAFQRDVRKSPLVALAQINFCWACFVAVVEVFESCNIEVIGFVSNSLGLFGAVGKELGSVFTTGFFVSGGIAMTAATFCMLAHQISEYITHQNDPGFDQTTEQVHVIAKALLFGLELVKLAGFSVAIISPIGVLAGAIGLWSFLQTYSENKSDAAEQKALLELAKRQIKA